MAVPQDARDMVICVPPRHWLIQPGDPAAQADPGVPDRVWNETETQQLLELFREGQRPSEIGEVLSIAERDVVVRLLRILMNAQGRLDDESLAFRSGEAYSRDDQIRLRAMYADGCSLMEISQALGRSPLGAGWKLLSMGLPAR